MSKKISSLSVLFRVMFVMVMAAALCTACMPDKDVSAGVDETEQLRAFATDAIERDITNYEANPEVKIKESKIIRLERIASFDGMTDETIEVYALEYRLLPEDLSKVMLAGGMQTDEKGWLKETCSMGSPLLVITHKGEKAELLGTLWTGGVQEDGGLEASVKALLEGK